VYSTGRVGKYRRLLPGTQTELSDQTATQRLAESYLIGDAGGLDDVPYELRTPTWSPPQAGASSAGHFIMRPALRMELICPIMVKERLTGNRVTNAATLCKSVWHRPAA
jgi:hypothetical protein